MARLIGPRTSIGERPHLVTLSGGGQAVPDGDGGWTVPPNAIAPPEWQCRITPASAHDLQRMTSGAAATKASHVLIGPYHPGITTATTIAFNGRTFYVNGVINPEERSIETVAFCEERVEGATP